MKNAYFTYPFPLKCLYWLGWWVLYVVTTIAIGGIVGCLLFPTVGFIFQMDYEMSYLFKKGLMNGAQYAGVWAGGLGIVLCFIRGHKMRKQAEPDVD